MTPDKTLKHVHDGLKKKFGDKNLVFGSGFVGAKIVFVGEAPGVDEEKDGKPVSGASAKLLNQLLKSIGLDKRKVYITNVLKYSPSKDKATTSKELKSHVPFLKDELKTVNPQIVVTLGTMALNGVGLRQPLDNVHGRTFNFGSFELFPTFHPSHALKDDSVKTLLTSDFVKLKGILASKLNQ